MIGLIIFTVTVITVLVVITIRTVNKEMRKRGLK